jgi:micrococcal nuclease
MGFDVQTRDWYDRLLAYVYLPDGKTLNEEIIRAGYAQIMTIPTDVKY